jgi:hypothetical protein
MFMNAPVELIMVDFSAPPGPRVAAAWPALLDLESKIARRVQISTRFAREKKLDALIAARAIFL